MSEELIKANCIFFEIAKLGSVAKASESLNITPNTIRKMITFLQTHLSNDLFSSHSKGVTLTADGQKYFDLISPTIDLFSTEVSSNLSSSNNHNRQLKYKIFCMNQGAIFLTRAIVAQTIKAFPNYTIQMPSMSYYYARNYGSHFKCLINGSDMLMLDPSTISLINPDQWNLSYRFEPLQLQLYASKKYLASWGGVHSLDDLRGINFIAQSSAELDGGQLTLINKDTKNDYQVDVNITSEIDFQPAKIELIHQGAGIGLIDSAVTTNYMIKDLVPILPNYHSNKKFHVMFLTKNYHPEVTRFIINKAKEIMNANAKSKQ